MKSSFYIAKVFLNPPPPDIYELTGGYIPVAMNIPGSDKTAICIWAFENNASIYCSLGAKCPSCGSKITYFV